MMVQDSDDKYLLFALLVHDDKTKASLDALRVSNNGVSKAGL